MKSGKPKNPSCLDPRKSVLQQGTSLDPICNCSCCYYCCCLNIVIIVVYHGFKKQGGVLCMGPKSWQLWTHMRVSEATGLIAKRPELLVSF